QGGPAAIRVAAGGAARGLRLAVNIDGVSVGAARPPRLLIGGSGDHRAVSARIRIAPGHRRARPGLVEGLHLRGISALLVLVVHRRADAIANQAADAGANQRARDMAAHTPAELRTDRRAAKRADQRAGVFLRSSTGLRIAGTGGKRQA